MNGTLTDNALVAAFLADKKPDTQRVYALAIRQFRLWVRRPLADVTPVLVMAWWASLASQGTATRVRKARTLRSLYRFAQLNHYVAENPFRVLATPVPPDRIAEHLLSEDEAQLLLDATRDDARAHALITLLLGTGCSIGEVAAAVWADLQLLETGDWALYCRHRPLADHQLVKLQPGVLQALERWRQELGRPALPSSDGWPLFPRERPRSDTEPAPASPVVLTRLIGRQAWRAGLTGRDGDPERSITAQWLRNTHAAVAASYGADLRQIQHALGLMVPSSTTRYVHGAQALQQMTSDLLPWEFD